MAKEKTTGEVIREARLRVGISATELAKRVGVSKGAVSQWENDQVQNLAGDNLVRLAAELRLAASSLMKGPRPTQPSTEVASWPGVAVDVFDVEAAAGVGRVVEGHEQVIGSLSLSREWLRGHVPSASSPNNLAVISALGDSMAPTFSDGDILLVDRGVLEAKIDAVFVIGRGDELLVKRIQRRLNGDLVIKSDNPLFDPETVPAANVDEIRILGRVLWAWIGRRP